MSGSQDLAQDALLHVNWGGVGGCLLPYSVGNSVQPGCHQAVSLGTADGLQAKLQRFKFSVKV